MVAVPNAHSHAIGSGAAVEVATFAFFTSHIYRPRLGLLSTIDRKWAYAYDTSYDRGLRSLYSVLLSRLFGMIRFTNHRVVNPLTHNVVYHAYYRDCKGAYCKASYS